MSIKIGGDTLALDADIRRQIESEAKKLEDRFTDERIETQATIKEEFDRLHGHRVRCELRIKLAQGRQLVVRDASKTAVEAITGVFGAARRSVRRVRWQGVLERAPAGQSGEHAPEMAGH
ncbi:Sigma 54 modulation protein / S30EA ribosomal protein [Marichromatium purpuratum 984]|uniref:Sigma 54 modulation protein / S30EA ribosomal protein n=1 Tax=Marichromatium purpuratum 984 TaxID=765910 RepID=W0DWW2_MARPU|nr:HPF/RaiA family ribosome-associated protein [Marichromatium purpuratum]AHF02947.1 Sigma 54 modulation protein / S30EA ribosomal protein [Marichromatium purpuratum 984]